MANGVLILLLLSTCLAAPITLISEIDFPFTDSSQNVIYADKARLAGNSTIALTAADNISQLIKTWYVKIDDKIDEKTSPIDPGETTSKGCKTKVYTFKQKINEVTKIYFDPSTLLPGNLLQLVDRSNFAKGILTAFIPESKRTPLNIILSNGLNDYFSIASLPSFMPKLKNILGKYTSYLNNQPIQIYTEQAFNIERVLRNLGLSTKIYEDLIVGGFTADKVQSNQARIVIVIYQKLFSASLDLTKNGTQTEVNLIDTIFNPSYSYDDFAQTSSYGYWRTGNPPQLVTQTNFGRLLVLSVDNILKNQKIIDRLTNCFITKGKINDTCIDSQINQIQTSASTKYYVAGVDAASAIDLNNKYPIYREFVSWKKVFSTFESYKSIENLRPLSARLTDLMGNKFSQTETRFFSIVKCGSIPDISIKITSLEGYCTVSYKGNKDRNFNKVLFSTSIPQTFDIGAIVGWQPFELKLTVKGKGSRSSLKKILKKITNSQQYNNKLDFSVDINGVQRFVNLSGDTKDTKQYSELVIKIDPTQESVS